MARSNRSHIVFIAVILTLLAAPIAYVASVGPFVWFADRDWIDTRQQTTIEGIYWPLGRASQNSRSVKRALDLYLSLFRGPVPSRDYPALNSY